MKLFRTRSLFKKIQGLKHQPFLYWPLAFQRITLCAGLFTCALCYIICFDVDAQKIAMYKKHIATLLDTIAVRKKIIQQASQKHSRLQPIPASHFIQNFSILAKKNQLEIVSIKPLLSKEPPTQRQVFQIHLTGSYAHVFEGMQEISSMVALFFLRDFDMTPGIENKVDVKMTVEAHATALQKNDFSTVKTIWILHKNPFEKLIYPLSVEENIRHYSFSAFQLKGTMQNKPLPWAVLRDPDNHLYFLRLHDHIGLEQAKIIDISAGKIALEWHVDGYTYTDYLEG